MERKEPEKMREVFYLTYVEHRLNHNSPLTCVVEDDHEANLQISDPQTLQLKWILAIMYLTPSFPG